MDSKFSAGIIWLTKIRHWKLFIWAWFTILNAIPCLKKTSECAGKWLSEGGLDICFSEMISFINLLITLKLHRRAIHLDSNMVSRRIHRKHSYVIFKCVLYALTEACNFRFGRKKTSSQCVSTIGQAPCLAFWSTRKNILRSRTVSSSTHILMPIFQSAITETVKKTEFLKERFYLITHQPEEEGIFIFLASHVGRNYVTCPRSQLVSSWSQDYTGPCVPLYHHGISTRAILRHLTSPIYSVEADGRKC